MPSPSAKRAWIEIDLGVSRSTRTPVALCEEGVDRNLVLVAVLIKRGESPSAKRAWIEIPLRPDQFCPLRGRPLRRGRG